MILIDANVLVYSAAPVAPQHHECRALVQRAVDGEVAAVLVPQVVLEAYSIVTSPRRVTQPQSPGRAWAWLSTLRAALRVKAVPPEALDEFETLIAADPRTGGRAFDLFLVAQMRCHGITDICTYNARDFALPGIRALEPSEV